MQFYIHRIHNPVLKPYIQYILFNYCRGNTLVQEMTSFANTNICLGVLKSNELTEDERGEKLLVESNRMTSYISGLYSRPHRVRPMQNQDEICIDFSPLGYYHFFSFPVKKYILDADILTEAFGMASYHYFESVFLENDFAKRAQMIETFFCKKLNSFEDQFLRESLSLIHGAKGEIRIDTLSRKMQCSEKKLYRSYIHHFDLSPQDYIRIVKFRNALSSITGKTKSLTEVAYECGYYDQSHFIREIKYFTQYTPKQCVGRVLSIDNTVSLSMS